MSAYQDSVSVHDIMSCTNRTNDQLTFVQGLNWVRREVGRSVGRSENFRDKHHNNRIRTNSRSIYKCNIRSVYTDGRTDGRLHYNPTGWNMLTSLILPLQAACMQSQHIIPWILQERMKERKKVRKTSKQASKQD